MFCSWLTITSGHRRPVELVGQLSTSASSAWSWVLAGAGDARAPASWRSCRAPSLPGRSPPRASAGWRRSAGMAAVCQMASWSLRWRSMRRRAGLVGLVAGGDVAPGRRAQLGRPPQGIVRSTRALAPGHEDEHPGDYNAVRCWISRRAAARIASGRSPCLSVLAVGGTWGQASRSMKQLVPWMTLSLVLVAACDGSAGEEHDPRDHQHPAARRRGHRCRRGRRRRRRRRQVLRGRQLPDRRRGQRLLAEPGAAAVAAPVLRGGGGRPGQGVRGGRLQRRRRRRRARVRHRHQQLVAAGPAARAVQDAQRRRGGSGRAPSACWCWAAWRTTRPSNTTSPPTPGRRWRRRRWIAAAGWRRWG